MAETLVKKVFIFDFGDLNKAIIGEVSLPPEADITEVPEDFPYIEVVNPCVLASTVVPVPSKLHGGQPAQALGVMTIPYHTDFITIDPANVGIFSEVEEGTLLYQEYRRAVDSLIKQTSPVVAGH